MKESMIKSGYGLMVVVAILAALIFAGCIESPKSGITPPEAPPSPSNSENNKEDIQFFKKGAIVYLKPAFYDGKMPLEYKYYTLVDLEQIGIELPIFFEFEDFRHIVKYDAPNLLTSSDPIEHILTFDRNDNLIAEAIVIDREPMTSVIEETHYSKDIPIFKAKSYIDLTTHEKVREEVEMGTKDRDYYFIWPEVRMH